MKVTILGSGSSGGVPLIGNYWGNCNPDNIKNNRTRVSIVVNIDSYNFLFDTSPDLRVQSIKNNLNNTIEEFFFFKSGSSVVIFRFVSDLFSVLRFVESARHSS